VGIEIARAYAIDVDTREDFEEAELLLERGKVTLDRPV